MLQSRSIGLACCFLATISWGIMFPVMTNALAHIDPFTFTALRYALAGSAFVALLLFTEGLSGLKANGKEICIAWFLGTAAFAGFGFLVFLGQQLAGEHGALTASIMMATQPMLGLLVNWTLRGAAPPKISFVFIFLSFCGAVLVITNGQPSRLLSEPQNFSADAMIICGALCWVLYTNGGSFFPSWSAIKYTTLTTGLGLTSVFAIVTALLLSGLITPPSVASIAAITPELVYMAFGAGFVGVLAWNTGNKIITPLNGVLFMDIVPLTSFAISALTELAPTRAQVLGALVTGSALIFNNIYLRNRTLDQSNASRNKPAMLIAKSWGEHRRLS